MSKRNVNSRELKRSWKPSGPLSRCDFEQLMAEAVDRFGVDALMPYVEAAARRYGWPIPPSCYDEAAKLILLPLMLTRAREG